MGPLMRTHTMRISAKDGRSERRRKRAHTKPGDNERDGKGACVTKSGIISNVLRPKQSNKRPTFREKTVDGLSGWILTHQSGKTGFPTNSAYQVRHTFEQLAYAYSKPAASNEAGVKARKKAPRMHEIAKSYQFIAHRAENQKKTASCQWAVPFAGHAKSCLCVKFVILYAVPEARALCTHPSKVSTTIGNVSNDERMRPTMIFAGKNCSRNKR